jgi:hypothetical protein
VVITACITLLFAGAIVWQYTAVQETPMPSIVTLLLVGIYLLVLLLRPVYYMLDSQQLVIHRV